MRTIKLTLKSGESIQKAIDSIKKEPHENLEIFLEKGFYKEKITINIPNVTFIGEDVNETIVDFNDANGIESPEGGKYGTFRSASFSVMEDAEGFSAKNLTFSNSFDYDNCGFQENRQAVALRCNADKSYFENCRFLGNQDTLLPNRGRQHYKNCYIEGHIDFIFGGAQAYFEKCEIFSKDRGQEENGYICAPSTLEEKEIGFIFENCKFLSDAKEKTVYLGRPWHPGKNPGHRPAAIFANSHLGLHIKDEGWTVMSGFLPEDARFYECENYGEGANKNQKRRTIKKEIVKKYINDIKF